ncbi:MAG: hypothetical protein DMD67_13010, partial [Gemmatimonadetes bacterium]
MQAFHQLLARGEVGGLAPAGIVELEHRVGHGSDLELDLADAVGEGDFVGGEPRRPAVEPEVDHLLRERELLLGRWITAQVAPDHLGLIEHRVFHLGVRTRLRQAPPEALQRLLLPSVGPDRMEADQQGRKDHEGETEEQFALEGHEADARSRDMVGILAHIPASRPGEGTATALSHDPTRGDEGRRQSDTLPIPSTGAYHPIDPRTSSSTFKVRSTIASSCASDTKLYAVRLNKSPRPA